MMWEKLGRIFSPSGEFGWMNSHAQVPAVLVKENEHLVRVYFATRPQPGKTVTTFLDLDIHNLSKVIYIHSSPVLECGRPGTFDEHGIMPSSVVELDNKIYLYYSGWQRSVGVPYNNYTGLAISSDGGTTFAKYSEAPILDRKPKELFSATSPCVLKEGDSWKMWYCSGVDWLSVNGKLEHTYDIKYAISIDGLNWDQKSAVAIPQAHEMEAITKPALIRAQDMYHMWFCFRSAADFRGGKNSYRIGYAYSRDGQSWMRNDSLSGITVSDTGWDSEMIAYPEIKLINGERYMFYNGNGFGSEGFGAARLIDSY